MQLNTKGYAEGYVSDSDSAGAPDQTELDVTLDIHPTNAFVDALWLRLRHARVDQDGRFADDLRDSRAMLNYEVPLL